MTHFKQCAPDRGAVAITFALVLVVLVGFVGLAIDVGSAYAKSQQVQNGADAAALAVAQECAEVDVTCSSGDHAKLAGDLAAGNIHSGYDLADFPKVVPVGNRVTVTVSAENKNFFAGLFGFNSFTVTRDATAQWEHPQAGPAMLPLTISACQFYTQAGKPVLNQPIRVWLPKGKLLEDGEEGCGTLDYPPGGFGWLDHTNCVANIKIDSWAPGDNGANRPVCLESNLKTGEVFLIPIFEDFRGKGSSAEFKIQRFAAITLLGWHFKEGGSNSQGGVTCPGSTIPSKSDYRDSCLNVEFIDWVEVGEDYSGGAPETEVAIIRLIDPEYEDSH